MPNPRLIQGLDELRSLIGREAGVSDWFTVSQELIQQFADITGDHQWIHVDPERAVRETPFGGAIAHGFLTLALLSRFSREALDVRTHHRMRVNYGLNRVRFVSPVVAGSRIRGRFTPQKVSDNEVIWQATVEIEGSEKPALVAEWLARFY
jgi:acyl dehydratase